MKPQCRTALRSLRLPARCIVILLALQAAAPALRADQLALADARKLARESSQGLKALGHAVGKAKLDVAKARSYYLPRLDLTASGSYLGNPPKGLTVARGELGSFAIPGAGSFAMPDSDIQFMPDTEHSYVKISATLTQPILTWGRIRASVDLAALQVQAASRDASKAASEIDRETKRAYHASVLARETIPLIERLAELAKGIVDDRRTALDMGSGIQESVLEAIYNAASIDATLAEARQGLATALASLSYLTGREVVAADLVTAYRTALPALDETSLRQRALAASDELASARIRVEQARKKVEIEKASSTFRPNLGLSVNAGITGQKLPLLNANWTDTWSWDLTVSLGATVHLIDSGESRASIGAASEDLAAVAASFSQMERSSGIAVRRGVDAAEKASSKLGELQAKSAWLALRAHNTEAAMESGAATRADADGATMQSVGADLDLLSGRFALEEALCDIEGLIGADLP